VPLTEGREHLKANCDIARLLYAPHRIRTTTHAILMR
jgi:hypothetical protein